jgi:hypothetical protein
MPNISNVKSPIILISPGRSGTTLISDIFGKHPECSCCGETVDLIFDLWNAAQRSISHITVEPRGEIATSTDERCAEFVRQGFLSLLNDEKSFWFQKPIGIPAAFSSSLFDVACWDEKAKIYWEVMHHVFPDAKYFTILRHPCDIVMSFKRRFALDEKICWAILGFLSHIIEHPDSQIRHAVSYEALAHDSEATLKPLMLLLGIDYCNEMMDSFNVIHTWQDDLHSSNKSEFSWENQWAELDPQFAEERFVEPIRKLYRKLGYDFALAPSLIENACCSSIPPAQIIDATASKENVIAEMRTQIQELEMHAANLNVMWEERAFRQENELHRAYLVMAKQIAELTADKEWLEGQYKTWRRLAEQRDLILKDMAVNIADIERGKRWLKSQAYAWEKFSRDLEIRIDALLRNPLVRILRRLGLLSWATKRPTDEQFQFQNTQRIED